MTREEALYKIKGYLTDAIPAEDYSEVEEIIKALEQDPCGECVNKRAVLEQIDLWRKDEFLRVTNPFDYLRKRINDLPPVLAEPKAGHWIEENINGGSRKVFCSECGCPPPFEYISSGDVYSASGYGVINKTKYCPNCGSYNGGAEK